MKISFSGLEVIEGKIKYNDCILNELEKKFTPKKVSPYFFEFIKEDFEKGEAIAIAKERLLDMLILDMEKLETRLGRADDAKEKSAIEKGLKHLEAESPLCEFVLPAEEAEFLRLLAPLSLKPTLVVADKAMPANDVITAVMAKAAVSFFYTAGKPEVHAWFIRKGSDIVTCAGKIHTDLARGFIKAEIWNAADLDKAHSMPEALSKGIAKLVDRDYIIQDGDIIEIRFSVSK